MRIYKALILSILVFSLLLPLSFLFAQEATPIPEESEEIKSLEASPTPLAPPPMIEEEPRIPPRRPLPPEEEQMMPPRRRPPREIPQMPEEERAERRRMHIERSRQAMEHMGAPPEMIKQGQMMMKAPMYLDEAMCLYARSAELGLNEKQKEELLKIQKEAREKALKLLTEEQKKKLGTVSAEPISMKQLCQQMMKKMEEKSGLDEMRLMMIVMGPMLTYLMEEVEPTPVAPTPEEEKPTPIPATPVREEKGN